MKKQLTSVIILLLGIWNGIGCSASGQSKTEPIDPAAFQQKMEQSGPKIILDVRTPAEYAGGHLAGAINYDIYDTAFASRLSGLDNTKPVFVYCKGGGRSAEAARQLKEIGFDAVYDLRGGIMAWERNGLPLADVAAEAKTDKVSQADFQQLLAQNEKLLIDFYAEWCLPCKKMEPDISRMEKKYAGKIAVVRINVDEARALSAELDIKEIPMIAVYRDGKELKRAVGYQSDKALRRLIGELE